MATNLLLKSLLKDTLSLISPEELLLVDAYNPKSTAHGSTARGPQGLNFDAEIILALPPLFIFFSRFLGKVADRSADEFYTELKDWIKRGSKKNDQKLHELISEKLLNSGVPKDDIPRTASAIINVISLRADEIIAIQNDKKK